MAADGGPGQPIATGFAAEMFVNTGVHYIAPDFVNVEATGGDLRPMVDQVRRAIAWVHRNAASFGGDPDRIHLYGHSSGAHLAGVAMVTDWAGRFGLPADVIKTGLLCSGMYDLKPVRLSARSRYVRFTDEIEQEFSPQRHIELFTAPVCWRTAARRRRSSSARHAISPLPCAPPTGRSSCSLGSTTIISKSPRRWDRRTGCSAAPRWHRSAPAETWWVRRIACLD